LANAPTMNYSLLDRLGVKADVQLYVAYNPATATPTTLNTAWVAYGDAIDAATSSQIVGGHILIPQTPDGGWKDAPAGSGNKNNEVINIDFANASNQYATEFLLPAYLDTFIVNGKVDMTVTELAALITAIVTTNGAADAMSRDGHDLTAVRTAFLTSRKRRRMRTLTQSQG